MKNKVKKIVFIVIALLVLALIVWRLWPVSLEKLIGADQDAVSYLSGVFLESGVQSGKPYIDTYELNALEYDDPHLSSIVSLLDSTKYRREFRNLLPWHTRNAETSHGYDGTTVYLSLSFDTLEESSALFFFGNDQVAVEDGKGRYLIFHPVDRTVSERLSDYFMKYGVSDAVPEEEQWTKEEILALFAKTENGNCPVLDCVPVTDGAYDMVGVVLYWYAEDGITRVAFLDAEGYSHEAGVVARAVDPPELRYVGDGTVVFLLEKEDGSTTNYAMSVSINDEGIHFKAEEGNMLILP